MKSRIRQALAETGVSESKLAKLGTMLTGEGDTPISYLRAAMKLTGYNMEWFVFGTGEKKGPQTLNISSQIYTESGSRDIYELFQKVIARLDKIEQKMDEREVLRAAEAKVLYGKPKK